MPFMPCTGPDFDGPYSILAKCSNWGSLLPIWGPYLFGGPGQFAPPAPLSRRPCLSFLWLRASHGEMPVVRWGVARYCSRNLCRSCFQFLLSTLAVRMAFPRVLIKRSASPFAFGQHGVIRRCWKPRYSANFLNSRLVNGGPLSLFTKIYHKLNFKHRL